MPGDAITTTDHDPLPRLRPLFWAGALLGLVVLAQLLPVERWLTAGAVGCREAGLVGVVGFALLYLLSTILMWPATILTVAAGWIWGGPLGVLILHPVSVVADLVPFLIARRLGPEGLGRYGEVAERLDAQLAERGFWAVCLLRWCPLLPYNAMNYALGCTRVSTRDYLGATFLATIPNSIVFVFAGALLAGHGAVAPALGGFGPEALLAAVLLSALSLIGLYRYGSDALSPPA